MDNIIILAIQLGITVAAFIIGKYVFPNVPKSVSVKLKELSVWAENFVRWAREFMKTSTGEEKMQQVVEQLKKIADEAGIKVTEEQLKAIAQTAYDAMKAGEQEAGMDTAVLKTETLTVPTVTIINNGNASVETAEKTAVATDDVPEDALEPNGDGTFNT